MIQIDDNDSPITAAQKIIHGIKAAPWTPASKIGYILATGEAPKEKKCEVDMFSEEEIREIAEYLHTYWKYHSGVEDIEYIDKHATAEHIDMYAKLLTMGDYRSGMMKAKEILLNQESEDIAPTVPKIIRGTDIVQVVRCKDCIHNNDCDIQHSAQAGENFFCGFGETEKDVREDVYE